MLDCAGRKGGLGAEVGIVGVEEHKSVGFADSVGSKLMLHFLLDGQALLHFLLTHSGPRRSELARPQDLARSQSGPGQLQVFRTANKF